jgi:drug/metabolite transporter (DMT)-like permease
MTFSKSFYTNRPFFIHKMNSSHHSRKLRGVKVKAILLGILSSVFFASTFILNRSMELSGGSWYWSASLRYIFMVPFLFLLVGIRGNTLLLFTDIKQNTREWFLWSSVGFGLFYAPITYAAASGPGWLVAGTWQFTIIAGILLTPFFYEKTKLGGQMLMVRKKIPAKSFLFSSVILMGIFMIQYEHSNGELTVWMLLTGVLPVVVAAFAYPLGNRKMMEYCNGRMETLERVMGMTLCSLPVWLALAFIGYAVDGPPSSSQIWQAFIVAICSGVVATVLFFFATDLVKDDPFQLAAVEATQSSQIVFVMLGEIIFLSASIPTFFSLLGVGLIMIGMMLHSLGSVGKFLPKEKAKHSTM